MPRFAFTFACFLLACCSQAASLQDPAITIAYYNVTHPVFGSQLNSLNNNDIAIGEYISCCSKPGSSYSEALTYNIQTGQSQGTFLDNDKTFQFSSLNNNGTFVGYGQLNDYNGGFIGSVSSFTFFFNSFTPFNVPGATSTFPNSINDAGVVVGGYISSADGLEHGFIYRPDGTFQTLDDPALKGTTLVGINNSGQIVGAATDGSITGFLYSGGTFTQLDYGVPTAINDAGAIAMGLGESSRYGGQPQSGGVLYPDGTLALTFGISSSFYSGEPFAPEAINDQGDLITNSASAFVFMPIAPEPASLRLLLCAAAASGVIGILRRRY